MIKNFLRVFIPEKIGATFPIPLKTVGIVIYEKSIKATIFSANGTKISVVDYKEEPLSQGTEPYSQKVSLALHEIIQKIGSYDFITTTIASSSVMFKEINFPFTDQEKIALSLNFEIESLLPFPLENASVSFITTTKNNSESKSSILATAIQSKTVEQKTKPFSDANILLDAVSFDSISLYGLYASLQPDGPKKSELLIDPREHETRVIVIDEGVLRAVRVIQKGFSDIPGLIKNIAQTLTSFSDNSSHSSSIDHATLFSKNDELSSKLSSELGITCNQFDLQKLLIHNKVYIPAKLSSAAPDLLSFASAYPLSTTFGFKSNNNVVSQRESSRINHQVITALVLSCVTLVSLAVHSFRQISILSSELKRSETEILETLKKGFPHLKSKSLYDALNATKREVNKESTVWSSFAAQSRQSFIKYLYDLSTKIDRETLGLQLKKMVITKKAITLEGKVRNFPALNQLEQQLKETKLFARVPEMQKLDFATSLTLDEEGGA